jgi:hypothetical protein
MKTLGKRLQRLERSFAPPADKEDDWGSMAGVRDEMLRVAARLGEPRCSEIRTEMDALGVAGLYGVRRSEAFWPIMAWRQSIWLVRSIVRAAAIQRMGARSTERETRPGTPQ